MTTSALTTSRGSFFLVLAAVLAAPACRPVEEPESAAARVVVADVLPRVPEGYTPYLLDEWQIPLTDEQEPVPAPLLEQLRTMSGLPVAGADLIRSRDPEATVLYMVRPRVVRPDSVLMLAGWMQLTTGDSGGGWGYEYYYVLDCRRQCRITGQPESSVWN